MKLPTLLVLVGSLGLGATLLFGQGREATTATKAQETYFASGQLESRVEYDNGRREGLAQRFFGNGSKQSEGRYAEGRMEGAWRFWNADGSTDTERTGTYHAGDRISPEVGAGS
jgi:antitoxin component YwqK of YwqJK toxin-antitoxin module